MSELDQVHYLERGGLRRRYVLHTSADADPAVARPLVVMLDGRGGTPWTAVKSTGWSRCADSNGFHVAYPEAIKLDPAGPQHFLDNPQMWRMDRTPLDDVGYLATVLDDVAQRVRIDPARIYFTGFSLGAAMCCRFAAEFPHRVAALGAVGGHCTVEEQLLARPVPALFVFGELDPINPVERQLVTLPWGVRDERPAVRETVRLWSRMCGGPNAPTSAREDDGVITEDYGSHVQLKIVRELGHVWPGGHRLIPEALVGPACNRLDGTAALWEFFRPLHC